MKIKIQISIILAICLSTISTYALTYDGGTLRTLPEGQLQGKIENGAQAFLGVPYAEPPQRFSAPQDTQPWAGVRQATSFSEICAQQPSFFGDPDPSEFENPAITHIGSEDCLYLNIWRPNNTSGNLPVLVWVHGGSNIIGAGSEELYHGEKLANEQGIIIVSVNYRLSSLGWFYHPALAATSNALDGSGNYAHLDLVKALEWVNDNIAEFGGNSSNITLGGQSAGCTNVFGLIIDRTVENLYDRVICQSGFPQSYSTTLGTLQSTEILYKLWVADGIIASELEGPAYEATQTDQQIADYLRSTASLNDIITHQPAVLLNHFEDGTVYPTNAWTRFLTGNYNKKPMIIGSTKDEGTIFTGRLFNIGQVEWWDNIQMQDPSNLSLDDFIDPATQPIALATADVLSVFMNVLIDKVVRSARLYQSQPIYRYDFEWDQSPGVWKDLMGAYHSVDLPFMFGNFPEQGDFTSFSWNSSNASSREALSAKTRKYFGQFIHNGNPNRMFDGLTNWDNWSNWSFQYKRLRFKNNGSMSMSFNEHFMLDFYGLYNQLSGSAKVIYDGIVDDEYLDEEDFPSGLLSD